MPLDKNNADTSCTNWGDASNWLTGNVPGIGDKVEFSITAKNNLILDVDRTIGDLTNKTNPLRQLIIPSARCLTVKGSIITLDNNPSRNFGIAE